MRIYLDRYCRSLEEESFENLPISYMSLESDEPLNQPFEKKEWCFIRLYETQYKNKMSWGNFLKLSNLFFSDKAADGKKYTHANLNYRLTDNYYGLNIKSLDQENALYIEAISEFEPDRIDPAASGYSVYGVKLTTLEYKNLKMQLEKMKDGNYYKYDILSLFQMAGRITKNRIEDMVKKGKIEKIILEGDDIPLNKIKKGLVCSSFVAFCLKNISGDINKYFNDSKKSVYEFAPNTLTKLPNLTFLFDGKFNTYKQDVREFVKKFPEFAKYNK